MKNQTIKTYLLILCLGLFFTKNTAFAHEKNKNEYDIAAIVRPSYHPPVIFYPGEEYGPEARKYQSIPGIERTSTLPAGKKELQDAVTNNETQNPPIRWAKLNSIRNSIEMALEKVPSGSFDMGSDPFCPFGRFWDEQPKHEVYITEDFWIGKSPVSNADYELFDPGHKNQRGTDPRTDGDDDPVVNVSWYDAKAFCVWLSQKEGKTYDLPTEAEWEYAVNLSGPIHQPTKLKKSKAKEGAEFGEIGDFRWEYETTYPNRISLSGVTGLVEQWTNDWYGPYTAERQKDPAGYIRGDTKSVRGRSYREMTLDAPNYLRHTTRFANHPADKNFTLGFRVVVRSNGLTNFRNDRPEYRWQQDVDQTPCNWEAQKTSDNEPCFAEPTEWMRLPHEVFDQYDKGPWLFAEQHVPTLMYCPNGDLLAACYITGVSTEVFGFREIGRELAIMGSRLKKGASEWTVADLFYDTPGRNDHTEALWTSEDHVLHHFQTYSMDEEMVNNILIHRLSYDNGVTWTDFKIIDPVYNRNLIVPHVFKMQSGRIVMIQDALGEPGIKTGRFEYGSGSAVKVSDDGGYSWKDLGRGRNKEKKDFSAGNQGVDIAGIHAAVTEYVNPENPSENYLIAFGRGDNIDGKMPMSKSYDGGYTWHYESSIFPPVAGGQRPQLIKLNEKAIMLISFARDGIAITDEDGKTFQGKGLYAAVSIDGGKTWPHIKLVSDGKLRNLNSRIIMGNITTDGENAETHGYMSAVQTPDNRIHLISSGIYYQFNFAWLTTPYLGKSKRELSSGAISELFKDYQGDENFENLNMEVFHKNKRASVKVASKLVKPFKVGETIFSNRPYQIRNVPKPLSHLQFYQSSIDSAKVEIEQAGNVFVMTPLSKFNPDSQEASLTDKGFKKFEMPAFELFRGGQRQNPASLVEVYTKSMLPGETLDLNKWAVIAF